jgi:hypothetical protein
VKGLKTIRVRQIHDREFEVAQLENQHNTLQEQLQKADEKIAEY